MASAGYAVASCDVENPAQRNTRRMKGILALLPLTVGRWSSTDKICFQDIVQDDTDVVVVMLLDARQPYSLRLFKRLCKVIQNSDRIHIVVATQNLTESFSAVAKEQHRTTYVLPIDERFGMWKMALGFAACPALAVVDCEHGRKFSHSQEELAVLWNEGDYVAGEWLRRRSAPVSYTHLTLPTKRIV